MISTLNARISPFLMTTLWIILISIIMCQQTNDFTSSMQMLQLVNDVRLKNNIRPLCLSEKLVRAATAHSAYQASLNRMTHDGPVSLGDRFVKQGYNPSAVAENVGFTSTPFIKVVFDIWMSSSEHRANILDPNYVHFGTASSVGSNNMYFWTQLFAKPMDSILESCDFAAAANAARITPNQAGFNQIGSWGGSVSTNLNSYNLNPVMRSSGNLISVDNNSNRKSLGCNLAGPDSNGYSVQSSSINLNNPINLTNPINPINQYSPNNLQNQLNWDNSNMPSNSYYPDNGSNQINNPIGSNIVHNPPRFDGKSCTVIKTSPAPDGQGSMHVLKCVPNPESANNPGNNSQFNLGPSGDNYIDPLNPVNIFPNAQSVPDGSAVIANPDGNVGNFQTNPMTNEYIYQLGNNSPRLSHNIQLKRHILPRRTLPTWTTFTRTLST